MRSLNRSKTSDPGMLSRFLITALRKSWSKLGIPEAQGCNRHAERKTGFYNLDATATEQIMAPHVEEVGKSRPWSTFLPKPPSLACQTADQPACPAEVEHLNS